MTTRQILNLDRKAFLADYWQSKPLLIRSAITDFQPPISSDELAGLAFERDVESRIIENVEGSWELQHGPFSERDYQRKLPWTLLVQAVDHFIPEVAGLRHLVDFIPQWRVDDVMVSYAVDGGSVGPHFDYYDVFLLQGEGTRLWRLGQQCDSSTALLPHDELRILKNFEVAEEYLLGPGDLLYIPPGIAHWGIAKGECTTFSLGFRAPRLNDMVSRWADQLLERMDSEIFYRDPGLAPATRPGEIRQQDIKIARKQLKRALATAGDERWFGELVTEPRYELAAALSTNEPLTKTCRLIEKSPAAKIAWQLAGEDIVVYANGESRLFSQSVLSTIIILCDSWHLAGERLQQALSEPDTVQCLDWLVQTGCLYVKR